ncbi:MAG: YifB family Mg chelatase-like AAA ATPase [Treponema sp.]|nr:YifB family Mg chelatase-like AAA ATPase [Candidatus Treponema caballi]
MRIISFSPFGYEGALVTVEVDLRRGIPAVDLVGLADNAVKEARERMRAAIRNSGFDFPPERVLISLSPADVKKEGAGFDLAIALGVLAASTIIEAEETSLDEKMPGVLVIGELELSGRVRPVRGVHAAISTAVENGCRFCIVPEENAAEADVFPEMHVTAVGSLAQAFHEYERICGDAAEEYAVEQLVPSDRSSSSAEEEVGFPPVMPETDFAYVAGQPFLVRALQIAAAGQHNLMAYGPPGCGKTLAMQRYVSLLPLLTSEESRSVTRIYSLAGLMRADEQLIRERPFRMPHQGASIEGMIGGGINCRPGEISLAHNGVLFLDEAAEFRSTVLQSLRVPLENGTVTLSRAGRHTVFPADFQLMIATNPCPCGNFGSEDRICLCSAHAVEMYWKKFSAPLLDRIDIRVPVQCASAEGVHQTEKPVSSAVLRKDIARAVMTQRKRQSKWNSQLTPEEILFYCKLDEEGRRYLSDATERNGFSTRAVHSCIKLARTIADMAGAVSIRQSDLEEAVSLRKADGPLDYCL